MPIDPSTKFIRRSFLRSRPLTSILWTWKRGGGICFGLALAAACPREAHAQLRAFHLDRVEVWGGPDDGMVVARPQTLTRTQFFGQLGLGYSFAPLHTSQVIPDFDTTSRARSSRAVVQHQLNVYATVGVHLFDALVLSLTLPFTPFQSGENPTYAGSTVANNSYRTTSTNTQGPSVGDARIDARYVFWRTSNRRTALSAQISIFAPIGGSNFGGDGRIGALFMVAGETQIGPITVTANTGIHLRPNNVINEPSRGYGLGVGNEWRFAAAAFLPLINNRLRVGLSIFGQTGIENSDAIGNTIFTANNTPLEWNLEGRMRFGQEGRFWAGVSGGTLLHNSYGAPDFRTMAVIGTYFGLDAFASGSTQNKSEQRAKWRAQDLVDSDHDGVLDQVDACPTEAEDHKAPDPQDGCPSTDRDLDGIPDSLDKCPDVPENKNGRDDDDGCPEAENTDLDSDGINNTDDACPNEPGKKNTDPKKNGCPEFIVRQGSEIRILQQIHFAFNSSKILADSFPVLLELVATLQANPNIKLLSVDGYTDNKGRSDYNKKLSQSRTEAVKMWLVEKGIASDRLEAHGHGMDNPIADNRTEKGRAANRRVEFKILKEESR